MRAQLAHWWRRAEKPDVRDLHIYGGLVLVGLGLYTLIGIAAVAVVGAVLFYVGVWRMSVK